MRHLVKGKKLSRKKDQRQALLKLLGENLIKKEKIATTETKAKELKRFIEKKITIAKKGDFSAQRTLRKYFSRGIVKKLINEIAPMVRGRKGGYTRIIKIGSRKKNGAKMVRIEIVK